MDMRDVSNHQRCRTSVVLHNAPWYAAFFLIFPFSWQAAIAKQPCIDLLATGHHTIDLDACRPAAVSTDEKRNVLESLPADGEVRQLTENERRKLKDLTAILRIHERDGVYVVKVISVPQAWTGLYGRAVLLISLHALKLLSSEELQALVAHEIGHEYIWQEYADAQKAKNITRLRELELTCDAIAVLTLQRVGIKADRLIQGLEKVSRYNRERFGWAINEGSYPPLIARRNLVKTMSSANRQRSPVEIQIMIYDAAGVGSKTLFVSENLVGEVLSAAGLEAKWLSGPISDLQRLGTDITTRTPTECASVPIPDVLRVQVLARAPVGFPLQALGFSLPCATTGVQVTIYADRIANVSETAGPTFGRVLGYAMAHELGHVLLHATAHEDIGLMKGVWSRGDWQRAAVSIIPFNPRQSRQIASAIQESRSRQMVGMSLAKSR
jgi:hypothetical protein